MFANILALAAVPTHHPAVPYLGGWSRSSTTISQGNFSFSLALDESGREEVRAAALRAADPTSQHYGNYLSKTRLAAISRASDASILAVHRWLEGEGVDFTVHGSHVAVQTSMPTAARLLRTTFHEVVHTKGLSSRLVRAADFELPPSVARVTRAIFGLHGLPLPPRTHAAARADVVKVTPSLLASTYGIGGVNVSRGTANRQAVAEVPALRLKPSTRR